MEPLKVATIKGVEMHYLDLNPKAEETIVLVHGHPFDHSMWDEQHEALSQYRLIIPDLKGYGASGWEGCRLFTEDHALDLALLLQELGISKVHMVGLSMGGQIVVEFHRLFGAMLQSLVICGSTPTAETEISKQKRLAAAQVLEEKGMVYHAQESIQNYINTEIHGAGSAVYRHLYRMIVNTSKESAAASHRGRAERRDNFSHLKEIQLPVLLICGDHDRFFSLEQAYAMLEEISNVSLEVIPTAGHLPNMEQPKAFNKVLTAFYQGLS